MSSSVVHRGGRARTAVTVYVAAVVAGATAAATTTIVALGSEEGSSAWEAAGFLALLAAAEYLIVRLEYRGQTVALTLFEAILAPAIVMLAPAVVLALVVASQTIAAVAHRIGARKAIFNVAQWTMAAAAGIWTFHAIGRAAIASAQTTAAILAALAVTAAVNAVLFVGIMRLTHTDPVWRIVRRVGPAMVVGWAANASFGLLFVLADSRTPAAMALFLVPLLALHVAYRGHAVATADRRRLARLNHALRAFGAPVEHTAAIERFLAEVRDCFDAAAVELVMPSGGALLVHRVGTDGALQRWEEDPAARGLGAVLLARGQAARIDPSHADAELSALVRARGWRDCVAAPVIADGTMLGMVCAFDPSGMEGFEDSELAVLQALATEAASMIRRGALLEQVLEERRRFSEIVTATSDGIMTVGADGTIHMWNPALEQMTLYPSDEMVGSKQLAALRPRDADGTDVLLERWAERIDDLPRDVQITDRTGGTHWLSCTYAQVDEEDASPRALIVVARDVTKMREVEQLKEDFVATVSHELRTPLTPIRGWATTLLERDEQLGPQERRIAAESIGRQAAHLERLITDLLQASEIERGIGIARDACVDLAAIAAKVIDDCELGSPGRRIVLQGDERAVMALGNDLWIERILSNLISNALKYAPGPEPIEVKVWAEEGGAAVAVTDHGPGIHPADHAAIFERFRRLGDPNTRAQGGAGLGLYIARQLAASIGGTLTLESRQGEGATFTLRLPAARGLALVV